MDKTVCLVKGKDSDNWRHAGWTSPNRLQDNVSSSWVGTEYIFIEIEDNFVEKVKTFKIVDRGVSLEEVKPYEET